MPDQVTNLAYRLLDGSLDPVPRYRLMRDVLQWPPEQPDLQEARRQAMSSRQVNELSAAQLADGSWGCFRNPDGSARRAGRSTDSAIVRALALGMDQGQLAIRRTIGYLENILQKKAAWPDQPEPDLNWPVFTELVTAARLSQLDVLNPAAVHVAGKWQDILTASLTETGFDKLLYDDAYAQYFGMPAETRPILAFSAFSLILLHDRLSYPAALHLADYLQNQVRGIYPIHNRSLRHLPLAFASRESRRFLAALDILADYPGTGEFLENAAGWIWEQMNNDGLWDFGPAGGDGLQLPLSASWRRRGSRETDCTIWMLSLMVRLQKTCEIRKTICHDL